MDLSIPIIGLLGFLGYKLNDTKQPRVKPNIRNYISPHTLPSPGDFSKRVADFDRKLADKQFAQAQFPEKTGVIPPFYNSTCKDACKQTGNWVPVQKSSVSNNPSSTPPTVTPSTLPSTTSPDQDLLKKRQNQILNGPMFRSDSKILGSIGTSGSGGAEKTGFSQILQTEENFGNVQISKLSGLPLELTHNNMTPFIKPKNIQNSQLRTNESIIENFTGVSADTQFEKTEVPNLFDNQPENIYGTKTTGDLVNLDRYTTSNLKTNLLPAPQILVQPLPPEYVRPAFKDINDLRAKINPKVSYSTGVLQGKALVDQPALNPQFSQNRPGTTFALTSDRYLVTPGENLAPALRENFTRDNDKSNHCEFNLTPAINKQKGVLQHYTDPPKSTNKEGNLFSYMGVADSSVNATKDYSADYNNTREKMYINNPNYVGNAKDTSKSTYNTMSYENQESYSKREQLRTYVPGPNNGLNPLDSKTLSVKLNDRRVGVSKYFNVHYDKVSNVIPEPCKLGQEKNTTSRVTTEIDMSDRINSEILSPLKNNPYSLGYKH
jgi:hypothetical protein